MVRISAGSFCNNLEYSVESMNVGFDVSVALDGKYLDHSYLANNNANYLPDETIAPRETGTAQVVFALGDTTEGELNDTTTPIDLSAIDYTIYSEEVELYSCVIQLDPSSPASGDNVIIAEGGTGNIAVNVGTADNPNSNGGSSSGGSGLTLEEYFEQHPEDYESFTSTMTSGMTCEVIGNDVTVTYAYNDVFDDAVIELMQPTFEAAMSSMDSTFKSTIGLIETSFGVSGVTLKVVYVDAAGTELYSKTY